MKKIIALFLCFILALLMLTACGQENQTGQDNQAGGTGSELKTGLAVISSVSSSADAGEKDGVAQIDSSVVAVTVDADGRITNCKIDAAQTKVNFSDTGKVLTPLNTVFSTKQERNTEYGMAKASSIKKEWFEQANAFAAYVTGKTLDEVKGIALNESGVPTAPELTSSVTIHVSDYIAAVEKAVINAQALGAKKGDKLGLGIVTTIKNSKDATADREGVAQAYSMYTAATFGADGKVTSSIIDGSQSDVKFTTEGKLTLDTKTAELKTKNELGDLYSMRKASSIKKEWNEQAAAFAKYATGKSINDIKGIALKEGVPTDVELSSSVTIHVTDFLTILEKASQNAN